MPCHGLLENLIKVIDSLSRNILYPHKQKILHAVSGDSKNLRSTAQNMNLS